MVLTEDAQQLLGLGHRQTKKRKEEEQLLCLKNTNQSNGARIFYSTFFSEKHPCTKIYGFSLWQPTRPFSEAFTKPRLKSSGANFVSWVVFIITSIAQLHFYQGFLWPFASMLIFTHIYFHDCFDPCNKPFEKKHHRKAKATGQTNPNNFPLCSVASTEETSPWAVREPLVPMPNPRTRSGDYPRGVERKNAECHEGHVQNILKPPNISWVYSFFFLCCLLLIFWPRLHEIPKNLLLSSYLTWCSSTSLPFAVEGHRRVWIEPAAELEAENPWIIESPEIRNLQKASACGALSERYGMHISDTCKGNFPGCSFERFSLENFKNFTKLSQNFESFSFPFWPNHLLSCLPQQVHGPRSLGRSHCSKGFLPKNGIRAKTQISLIRCF